MPFKNYVIIFQIVARFRYVWITQRALQLIHNLGERQLWCISAYVSYRYVIALLGLNRQRNTHQISTHLREATFDALPVCNLDVGMGQADDVGSQALHQFAAQLPAGPDDCCWHVECPDRRG